MDEIGIASLVHADEGILHQVHPPFDHLAACRLLPFHLLHRRGNDSVLFRIEKIVQAQRIGTLAVKPAVRREQLGIIDLEKKDLEPGLADLLRRRHDLGQRIRQQPARQGQRGRQRKQGGDQRPARYQHVPPPVAAYRGQFSRSSGPTAAAVLPRRKTMVTDPISMPNLLMKARLMATSSSWR